MGKLIIVIGLMSLFLPGRSYASLPKPKKDISKQCSLEDNIENHCTLHHKYRKGIQNNWYVLKNAPSILTNNILLPE
jgi:hypothetical protein